MRNADKSGLDGRKTEGNLKVPKLESVLREIAKRSKERAKTTHAFFTDLGMCISEIKRVLKSGE